MTEFWLESVWSLHLCVITLCMDFVVPLLMCYYITYGLHDLSIYVLMCYYVIYGF